MIFSSDPACVHGNSSSWYKDSNILSCSSHPPGGITSTRGTGDDDHVGGDVDICKNHKVLHGHDIYLIIKKKQF